MKKIDDSYSYFISLACMAMNCESSNTYNLVCHGLWQQKSKIVDKPFQPISKEEHEVVLKYEINLLNAIVKKVREKNFNAQMTCWMTKKVFKNVRFKPSHQARRRWTSHKGLKSIIHWRTPKLLDRFKCESKVKTTKG